MAQLYNLYMADNSGNKIDFLSSNFRVSDGGLDISLPAVDRKLSLVRPGFHTPISQMYEHREAKITFNIYGASHTDIIASENRIERMLRSIAARMRMGAGSKVELAYSWKGSTNITYFEVYGGDVRFPSNILSVEQQHTYDNTTGLYAVYECELTLLLSTYGYGLSIFSDSPTEVALYNPSVGSKRTGGVNVKGPATDNYNYVEIDGTDLPGGQPLITKLMLTPTAGLWGTTFIGLQQAPFYSALLWDSTDTTFTTNTYLTTVTNAQANNNSYKTRLFNNTVPAVDTELEIAFDFTYAGSLRGMYYVFYHGFGATPYTTGVSFSTGFDDDQNFGVRYMTDFVTPVDATEILPIAPLQFPVGHPDLLSYQNTFGFSMAYPGAVGAHTLGFDFAYLLPITNGLRILQSRVGSLVSGVIYDDDWKGMLYMQGLIGGFNTTPLYGLLEPLKLEPGVTQRLYFNGITPGSSSYTDRNKEVAVRLFVVPTYMTLAY